VADVHRVLALAVAGGVPVSAGAAIRWADAHLVATELVGLLAGACERIEIAGSVRRRKGEVHDIEIVAIPRHVEVRGGLWSEDVEDLDLLAETIAAGLAEGELAPRAVEIHRRDGTVETGRRMGDAYKALVYRDMPVDLFITDAERWGCIFALRTGPGDWNTRLVTDCKRHWRRVEDGRVLYHNRVVPTPTEEAFFAALGVPWLDPWERHVDRLRFDPGLLREVPA
jgi:DNA polymerase/3'-5' exonuclease PolX